MELLAARVAALPAVLDETLRAPLPALPPPRRRTLGDHGVGGSEGPARVMAGALRRARGDAASFVPLSRFACDGGSLRGDVLVVFSQGLCPNARIALTHKGFALTLVVSARPVADVTAVLRHPPEDEGAMLARVQGPPAATLQGLRVVASLGGPDVPAGLVGAVRAALAAPAPVLDLRRPVALLRCDDELELGHGLRWKWLEATRRSDVAVYDALGFAHGPLQCCAERGAQVVLLTRDDPREGALWARVRAVLAETGCAVHTLAASLPGAWSFFEHDARWSATLCASLAAAGDVDLLRWPTQGRDGPLYDLDAPLTAPTGRVAR
ncbi:MAG: hypothetical protein U0325_34980 [Polyangiales bacterium]